MPSFEHMFARLTYVGGARSSLSAMRYAGEWIEIFPDLTLDERRDAVRDDSVVSSLRREKRDEGPPTQHRPGHANGCHCYSTGFGRLR